MLSYSINPPPAEKSEELLPGEKKYGGHHGFDKDSEDDDAEIFTNSWVRDVITRRQARVVLLQVYSHKNMLVVPIKWEGSVRKLLAEYTSVANLVYDIPVMEPAAAAGEILRRCKYLVNHPNVTSHKTSYSTPYDGFYHSHMPEFNKLVLQALAVPHGLTMTAVLKEQSTATQKESLVAELPQRTATCGWSKKMVTITELQWPYRLSAARLIDGENSLWSFDLTEVLAGNKVTNGTHVDYAGTGFFFYPKESLDAAAIAKEIKRQFGTEDVGSDLFQDFDNLSKRLDYIKINPQFHVSPFKVISVIQCCLGQTRNT